MKTHTYRSEYATLKEVRHHISLPLHSGIADPGGGAGS